jgi:hypothetical protein
LVAVEVAAVEKNFFILCSVEFLSHDAYESFCTIPPIISIIIIFILSSFLSPIIIPLPCHHSSPLSSFLSPVIIPLPKIVTVVSSKEIFMLESSIFVYI